MRYLIMLLALISINSLKAQSGYEINGNIRGLTENTRIYLINARERKIIDSAVVKNEKFILKGRLKDALHTYLFEGKNNKLADILLDNRNIKVLGETPNYDDVKIIGSNIDEQWKQWYKDDQKIGYLRYRITEVTESLITQKDTVNSKTLGEITDELLKDRVSLLKSYVKKYGNFPSGALLPTLCTIQEKLTKSDFLEMFNCLSPEMQKTDLGKEVLELSNKK
jgi:Domain of unknown function (DUF4369)